MTYELNAAFDRAARDDEIKVIILAGEGRNFSAGHDLGGDAGMTWRDFETVGTWAGFDAKGAEARYGREMEIYLEIASAGAICRSPPSLRCRGNASPAGSCLPGSATLSSPARTPRSRTP